MNALKKRGSMLLKTVYPSALGQDVPFIDCVDDALGAGFSGFHFNPVLDFNICKEDMLSLIQKKHIVPMGMELPIEFREGEDRFLDDLNKAEKILEYASFIGIKRAVTWIVPFSDSLTYKENFKQHVTRLRRILDILNKYSIRLGLEFQGPKSLRKGRAHWFVHTLDGALSLISAIDRDNCGLLLDSWHWQLAGEEYFDFGSFDNAYQVVCVHVNDAPLNIAEDELKDLERSLPGSTGRLDIKSFIKGLKEIGYSGPVIAEPFDSSLSRLSPLEAFRLVSASIDKVL